MPSVDAILAFTVIVTLIVTSPGPNLFLLLRTTPSFGRYAGFANTLGFSAAILSHALLSLIGVGAVITASALAFSVLKIAGAVYLMWLGFKALRSAWKGDSSVQANRASNDQNCTATHGLGARFVEGYLTNILNPKPAFFYLAAFPQFIDIDGLPFIIQGMALGAIHASIAILWYSLIVFGIGTISQWMTRPAFWRLIQTISGTALVALGARLLSMRQAT